MAATPEHVITQDPPSFTALSVLKGFIGTNFHYTSEFPDLVDEETKRWSKFILAHVLRSYPWGTSYAITSFQDASSAWLNNKFYEMFGAPFYSLHLAMRKQYVRHALNRAIEDGVEQVLYVGGGFDVMCLVEHRRHPTVEFFEMDRGLHWQFKRRAVAELRQAALEPENNAIMIRALRELAAPLYDVSEPGTNLHYVEGNMALPDWPDTLMASGFDPNKPTFIAAEGFTMYLTPEQLTLWYSKLLPLLAPDSQLLLGLMDSTQQRRPTLMKALLRQTNEVYGSSFTPEQAPGHLFEHGFSPFERLHARQMLGILNFLSPEEVQATPVMSENYYVSRIRKPDDVLPEDDALPIANIQIRREEPAPSSSFFSFS